MNGETNVDRLIKSMRPRLNEGRYVFCTLKDPAIINREATLCEFKEAEGTTVVIRQEYADQLGLDYDYVAAWITLEVHSALEAVGLTAAFSTALAKQNISCNVIAGYYHDHIFVAYESGPRAIEVLENLASSRT